ncbi:reverse transcriptase domain-containing protein [Tanacetum coccineum]|uniref:Reverse transcriptase domain-containing protein n=1 Tax=Tanacetum coccineum TaxID=301880 RepID=A0ABQ4XWJ3_9ASTR
MPYSLYAALSGTNMKPTRMSIRLENHTYQYPMGVAENMLIQVGKFVFPVYFVILQIEEDDRVPLILGRPFLHTAGAIIRVKNKELNLGIREDISTFLIDKAIQHSHLNDDTCFHMDVIDEVTEDELDALLYDSKPFLSTSEKIRIGPSFCKHKINFEDDVKPIIQRQRRLNPNMKEVVKKEIIKLLDAGIIYAIEDSPWFDIEIKNKKGAKNVAADHLSRLEKPNLKELREEEINDEFPDEFPMSISTDKKESLWFADFANYLVGGILRKGLAYAQRCKFLSELKHYFWDEPYLFKACPDGTIKRCVHGLKTQKILDECHHGPTVGHYGYEMVSISCFRMSKSV